MNTMCFLRCLDCPDAWAIPFRDADQRVEWAAEHAGATGHLNIQFGDFTLSASAVLLWMCRSCNSVQAFGSRDALDAWEDAHRRMWADHEGATVEVPL